MSKIKDILLVVVLIIAGKGYGYCCSCSSIAPVETAFNQSEVIVSGSIQSIERVLLTQVNGRVFDREANARTAPFFFDSIYVNKASLCVADEHKGIQGECEIIIYTATNGAECGVSLEVGRSYTVYGGRSQQYGNLGEGLNYLRGNNVIWTNSCTRTAHIDSEEVRQLDVLQNIKN